MPFVITASLKTKHGSDCSSITGFDSRKERENPVKNILNNCCPPLLHGKPEHRHHVHVRVLHDAADPGEHGILLDVTRVRGVYGGHRPGRAVQLDCIKCNLCRVESAHESAHGYSSQPGFEKQLLKTVFGGSKSPEMA